MVVVLPGEDRWPTGILEGWDNVDDLRDVPGMCIYLHSMAALTAGKTPRLEAADMASSEVANCYFSLSLPRRDDDVPVDLVVPTKIPDEELWSPNQFPRDLDHLKHDSMFETLCCKVWLLYDLYPLFLPVLSCCTALLVCVCVWVRTSGQGVLRRDCRRQTSAEGCHQRCMVAGASAIAEVHQFVDV